MGLISKMYERWVNRQDPINKILRLHKFGNKIKSVWIKDLFIYCIYLPACRRKNIDIDLMAKIGNNFKAPHQYIVIGRNITIGNNVTMYQYSTIGRKDIFAVEKNKYAKCPTIEDNVIIGTNCIVAGDITIGHHSIIASNSVVTKDVPPHSLAVGVNNIKKMKKK